MDTRVANPARAQCGKRGRRRRLDRNDAQRVGLRHCAATAFARAQALLALRHRLRQAFRRQQQEALVRLVGPAQRDAVGARDAPDPLRKAAGQPLERGRLGHQRRHVVQRLQSLALFLELRRLLGHASLEAAVHRLQVLGHPVEAFGERAELVAGDALHAGAEISALDPFRRLLQAPYRLEHEQVAGVEQHAGADDREGHHRHLQQMEERRPAHHVALDAGDQQVDVGGERHDVAAQSRPRSPAAPSSIGGGIRSSPFRRRRTARAPRRPTARTADARGRRAAAARGCARTRRLARGSAKSSPVPTDSDIRYACIRMRPASLTAAAPPSSCQDTHSVRAIDSSASSRNGRPTSASLPPRLQCRGWLMSAIYPVSGCHD